MRSGSERILNKNTKTFANIAGGLARIKIEQLLQAEFIEKIVISTNDIQKTHCCPDKACFAPHILMSFSQKTQYNKDQ